MADRVASKATCSRRSGSVMSGRIVDFYEGNTIHPDGFAIDQVWNWNDKELEYSHTYIQWLFPSRIPSSMVSDSPVISQADIVRFKTDSDLRKRFARSYVTVLRFYGFRITDDGSVMRADDFVEKSDNWLTPSNHNYLRITRILKAMMMFGFEKNARDFLEALHQVYRENPELVGASWGFWQRACV